MTVPKCAPAGTASNGATNITSTTATLNGATTPNGDAGTRAYFKWGSTNTGDCYTLSSSTSATLLSGTTSQPFTSSISGLSNLTSYYFCTIVYNNSGTSYGDIATFVAQNSVPSLSTPTSSAVTATTATLGATVTSNGGSSLTARGTCWGTSPAPAGNCTAEGSTLVSSFTHGRTGLTSGTTIYYRGYATNGIGTGYSADGSFQTPPVAPTLSGSSPNSTQNNLSWNSVSGATSYTVKACSGAGCTPVGNLYTGASTSYNQTSVTCGLIYRYSVYVTGPTGTSADSNIYEVTPLCAPSGTPTLSGITSSAITVTYNNVSGATYHNMYRCTVSNCSTQFLQANDTASPWSDSGLTGSTNYWYRVQSVNTTTNATSNYSNISAMGTTLPSCTNGYVDGDGDGYGSGSYGCYSSGTIVASGGDCYDVSGGSGATNTRPGQTSYFTTPNGLGSYDYNCVSGQETNVTALGLWSDYPGSITCKTGSDLGSYNGTLYGAAAPNSGSCTYGSSSYNGRTCSNVKGTNAACGDYYATGTSATGWWHISSGCWGSSYKKVTGTVGCR